jgi:hypothetical protein
MSADHSGPQKSGFQLPGFDALEHSQHAVAGYHPNHKRYIALFVIANVLFFIFSPQQTFYNYEMVIFLSPIWLTVILGMCVYKVFGQMNLTQFLANQEYVLLELKIPREVTKTPLAMETFFSNMHIGSGETTAYKRYFEGGRRPWWSLEIVSLGGRLHMYIWTRTGYRRLVENFLYAQYPDIEIIEAEDYSLLVDPSEHGYGMFAAEYKLSKDNNAIPIKTYVDYKMEPGDKPEESVDPMGSLFETIAGIGPKEQFWIQIMFRMTKKEKWEGYVNKDGKPYGWNDQVKEAIESIRTETVRKTARVDPVTGAVTETESFPNPSRGQTEGISNIERNASKQIFDVGIRSVYLAPEDAYVGIMVPAQINMFKPFNNENGNSLSLRGDRWTAMFNDLPWEDRGGHHKHHLNHIAIQMYRRRAYFHTPYKGPWMNLSTEELATLFHIPSSAVTTPNLERIQSSTSTAPANLPS